MRLSRKSFAAGISILTALTLSACTSHLPTTTTSSVPATVGTADLTGVTLNVGDQKGVATAALLTASGALVGAPYKLSFANFTSGPPQVEAANAGRIDFAVVGNTPPIFGAAQHAGIKVVSAYQTGAYGDQILVPKDSTLSSVGELKGKKVAVAKSSSANGNLLLQLRKAGLQPADLSIVYLQPADALAAFSAGQVDAWAIWDPYTAIAQVQQNAKTLVDGHGVANGLSFGIASTPALADARKNAAVQDLVARLAKANSWAVAHPDTWSVAFAHEVAIDPAAAAVSEKRRTAPAIAITDNVVTSEQQLADAFAATGQIQTDPTFADFVDTRYNDTVTKALAGQ